MESVGHLEEKYFSFAHTGKRISPLGFGTVKIGRNTNVKNACADGFALPTMNEVKNLLAICRDAGINLLDTAPAYGLSESVLGEAIAGDRTYWFLSSKVGEEFDGQNSQYIFTKDHTIKSVERSLKRLKTDHLDSVLVHCPREDLDILENSDVLSTLQALKTSGKILSFGASTNSLEGGLFAAKYCDSVMVSYNVLYKKELPVIKKALQLGKGVFIKKGLLQGRVGENSSVTIDQCFSDIFSVSQKVCVVFGTINPQHLKSNIAAAIGHAFN